VAIQFRKYLVDLQFGNYANNDNNAIQFVGAEEGEHFMEAIATATVNGDMDWKGTNIYGFKSWGEGPDVVECLTREGIIDPSLKTSEPAGFGKINYHEMTDKGIQMREDFFKEMEEN